MTNNEPSGSSRYRVRVFIDFWNFTLSMRVVDGQFRTDWKRIGLELARAAIDVVNPEALMEYQGLNFYGSYDIHKDQKLLRWATTILDTFPGIRVSMVPRQNKRSAPSCPLCYHEVLHCPRCEADMRGTEEKGVDVRMATEMISLAWEENYDIAVLVSSDRDFVPVAEYLDSKGVKVIHAAFPPKGALLTQKCWGSINLGQIRARFQRR